jgi:iron(III) transport system substrate-binding protein
LQRLLAYSTNQGYDRFVTIASPVRQLPDSLYLPPVTLLPSAIGIDAKAPAAEQAEAKQFVEFVLSPAGQHVMQTGDPTGDSVYYPVIQGVNPLPALPSLASTKTQSIDPYTWGPQEGTINTWFDNNIVR